MNRSSALIAAAPRPGTCRGDAAASQTDTSIVAAWLVIRASDVCPRPRRGEFAIRVNATTSYGLASSDR